MTKYLVRFVDLYSHDTLNLYYISLWICSQFNGELTDCASLRFFLSVNTSGLVQVQSSRYWPTHCVFTRQTLERESLLAWETRVLMQIKLLSEPPPPQTVTLTLFLSSIFLNKILDTCQIINFLIMLKLYTVAGIISGDLLYNKNRENLEEEKSAHGDNLE